MLVRGDGKKRTREKRSAAPPAPIVAKHLLYEIEKVVDTREGNWGTEYYVKWRGYRSSENMWISDIPVFFDKRSKFYKIEACDHNGSTESDSSESDEDEVVDSDEDEVVDSSDDEVVEVVDSDEEYSDVECDDPDEDFEEECTSKKRKRVVDSSVAQNKKNAKARDIPKLSSPKNSSLYNKKFLVEESESDDEGVGPASAELPSSKSKSSKSKMSKKEQLAMRALVALAESPDPSVECPGRTV
jgi:hypothetical protein